VDLARVDVRLAVALGGGELLGQALAAAALAACGLGVLVAVAADGLRVDGPAGQLAQQQFGLAEGVVDAGHVGHASGAGGEPAGDAEQPGRGELGLAAGPAVAMRALEPDRPDGGHDLPLAAALEADRARARAGAGRPPFSSAASTRAWAACCRVRRSRSW